MTDETLLAVFNNAVEHLCDYWQMEISTDPTQFGTYYDEEINFVWMVALQTFLSREDYTTRSDYVAIIRIRRDMKTTANQW